MSSWSCPHEHEGRCNKVARALCRPGMKGCVLVGKVTFQDGKLPDPEWPESDDTDGHQASGLGPQGKRT